MAHLQNKMFHDSFKVNRTRMYASNILNEKVYVIKYGNGDPESYIFE